MLVALPVEVPDGVPLVVVDAVADLLETPDPVADGEAEREAVDVTSVDDVDVTDAAPVTVAVALGLPVAVEAGERDAAAVGV